MFEALIVFEPFIRPYTPDTNISPLLSRATILFAVFVVVASILHVVAEPPLYTLPIIYELLVRVATVVPILLADFHWGFPDIVLDVKT